jgi:hypothetical protein
MVDYLGGPEMGFAPIFIAVKATDGLAPILEIIADPDVEAIALMRRAGALAGRIAVVFALVKKDLGVTDSRNVCNYHFFISCFM